MEKCRDSRDLRIPRLIGLVLLQLLSMYSKEGPFFQEKNLKVGPGDTLFTGRESWACVNLNSNAEGGRAHRTRRLEALHGLDEAPSRHGAHLDVPSLELRVAADDAPPIIERPDERDLLAEREHELVRQHG